jgi:mannose-6-phosphate isomerase-like protein (cupin superfamily)
VAHFELAPRATSIPVVLPRLDEIWFFVSGRGQMWRSLDGHEETVDVEPGTCLTIPAGTHFQFRSMGDGALAAVGVTMPPWPLDDDAAAARVVDGPWEATRA